MTCLYDFAADMMLPPPKMTAWEWCEEHVILPPLVTNRSGPWRSEVTPYVREPMEAVMDPKTQYCVFVWSAQSSKTQMLINIFCHLASENPMNCLWMMPSVDLAKGFSKERLNHILKACDPVAKKLSENRHEDNLLSKIFTDMTLTLVGGNSAANLSSRPCGIFIGDEIDKLPKDLNREACPVALAIERTKTYQGRRKIILASTPTTRDHKIWSWLENGTYEKLYWPCPHCEKLFTPSWQMVKWDRGDELTPEQKAASAYIECPHCNGHFLERHKRRALQACQWIATQPDKPKTLRSFHLSEIQSPFTPLPQLVLKFLAARAKARMGDLGELQNFINSSLAEPWEEGGYSRKDPKELHHMKSGVPRGVVPMMARALTWGADTQDNGFWYIVWGWGAEGRSFVVQEGFVETLEMLEAVTINATYFRSDGKPMQPVYGMIDSAGHRTDEVRRWTARHQGKVSPIFGRQRLSKCVTFSDIDGSGNTFGSMQQGLIDTNFFKNAISTRMRANAGDPGYISVHAEASEDLFTHMTAEYLDEKQNWTCPKHAQNHLWDCMVYAAAAAYVVETWAMTEEQARRLDDEQGAAAAQKPRNRQETASLW